MLHQVKQKLKKALCVLTAAAMSVSSLMIPVSAETVSGGDWPVRITGQVVTVPEDGKEHTASGYTVGSLPEGAQIAYNGSDISVSAAEPGEYTKDFDINDFVITGNDRYNYIITQTPVTLNILSKDAQMQNSSDGNNELPDQEIVMYQGFDANVRLNLSLTDSKKDGTVLKDDGYQFDLEEYDNDTSKWDKISSGSVNAEGIADFGKVSFTEAGTKQLRVTCTKAQEGCSNPGSKTYTLTTQEIDTDDKYLIALAADEDATLFYTADGQYKKSGSSYVKVNSDPAVVNLKLSVNHGERSLPVRLAAKVSLDDDPVPVGIKMTEGMFTFEFLDKDQKVLGTASNDANGNVYFDVNADSAKIGPFYVRQVKGSDSRIHYDTTVYQFSNFNIVSQKFDDGITYLTYIDYGKNPAEYYRDGGKYTQDGDSYKKVNDDVYTVFANGSFVNWTEGNTGSPIELTLNAKKVLNDLTGKRTLKDGEFSFKLTGSDGTNTTQTNDADGNLSFQVKITEPGTYTYQLEEIKGTDESVDYSTDVKTLKVRIVRIVYGESAMLAVIDEDKTDEYPSNYVAKTKDHVYYFTGSGNRFESNPDELSYDLGTFINTCGALKADITFTKHIVDINDGTQENPVYLDDHMPAGWLKFSLYPVSYSFTTEDTSVTTDCWVYDRSHPIATATNDENGKVTFHGISFDHVGSYRFYVQEDGISEGFLNMSWRNAHPNEGLLTTTYGSCAVFVTVSGTKNADGSYRDIKITQFSNDEFLNEADADFKAFLDENNKSSLYSSNHMASTFSPYNEQVPAKISKNLDGTYSITGQSMYNPAAQTSLKLIVNATKILKSGSKLGDKIALKGNEYEFNLLDSDGSVLATAKNDADGKVHFEIEFSSENVPKAMYSGSLYVQEVKGSDPDIVYDENKYEVDAKITTAPYNMFFDLPSSQNIYPDIKLYTTENGYHTKQVGYYLALMKYTGDNSVCTYVTTRGNAINGGKAKTFNVLMEDTGYGFYVQKYVAGSEHDTTEEDYTVGLKDNAEITNIKVKYSPADLLVTAKKELSGRTLKADEFLFHLKSEDGTIDLTAKNDADGKISFDKVTIQKPGTYVFQVYEDNSNPEEGITYDKTIKKITVTATDKNQDGVMELDVKQSEQ